MSRLLNHLIETAAQARPEAEALAYRGVRLSYGELLHGIEATAAGLQGLGLKPGVRVAVYLPKQLETVQALFGTALAGGILVPINPLLKALQVAHILDDSGATVLITSRDRAKLLTDVLPACKSLRHLVTVDAEAEPGHFPSLNSTGWQALQSGSNPSRAKITEADTAAILYTSGSTGKPKGVALSHRNLALGAESVAHYLGTQSSDRLLAVLPLSFDYGLSQLTTTFHAGASVVLMNYLLPREVLRAVSQEGITTLAGVPSLWMQLAPLAWPKGAANTLRTITNSGGHLPIPVIEQLRERLPTTQLFLMYGLTEAFRSSFLPPEELATRPGSMGKAIPHAELAVVRPDGTPCDPGEEGELVHAGPLVTQGYWNNPEETARRFRPPPVAMADRTVDERVVWSGDTVTLDEDGYLYFVGREDAMIKTSGYRVSPSEVEEVVHRTGLVSEVAVFGVSHPLLGQGIVAVVSPSPDSQPEGSESALGEQILQACKVALPGFMVPLHIAVISQLPKTPNGKIDRQSLQRDFQGHFVDAS